MILINSLSTFHLHIALSKVSDFLAHFLSFLLSITPTPFYGQSS